MTQWEVSRFTAAFSGADGELVLCNSFMGSLVRVASADAESVRSAIANGLEEPPTDNPTLALLCDRGYFVRSDLDEGGVVREILRHERDERGFSLILLPHENCNFRCTYCYETFERGKMSPDVVAGVKALVARRITSWGSLAVQWFGGEPLLARDVIQELSESFIDTCHGAGAAYSAGITTNGFFLTPEVAAMLLDRRVRRFQVTLDGPPDAHNARRHLAGGGETYAVVLRNLSDLRLQPEPFVVRLRVNFDPDSIEVIESWLPELAERFAGDERFQISFHPIGRWGGPNDATMSVCDDDLARTAKLDLLEDAYSNDFARGTMREFLGAHGSSCYAGKESSVVIGSDGTIYKCTVAFADPRNHVGRLARDGSWEIDPAKWDLWVKTDGLETGKCSSCWFHASCESRTCPLVAMDNGEPPCPSTPAEMEGLVQLVTYGSRVGPHHHHQPRKEAARPRRVLLPLVVRR